eukprot:CAMPEP_0172664456 /NCGR_PEP_ID=MMETSP1074-20121228/6609_1 /TAXON_ID=2916 /ORGANISM="Ceratium fusus, Strain PA161109" /LENGTH=327 /DNA_ID=CAMNT_0013480611 /DNA_START=34 /DNA_END=1014 /DNA_ORIENTATION=-
MASRCPGVATCLAGALVGCAVVGFSQESAFAFGVQFRAATQATSSTLGQSSSQTASLNGRSTLAGVSTVPGVAAVLVAVALTMRGTSTRSRAQSKGCTEGDASETSRRPFILSFAASAAAVVPLPGSAIEVDVPDRINADPYELIGMTEADTENAKLDRAEFYMHKVYKTDTYQVLKHMKISASLDKGTPNMEKWNKRIKEEMNDWVALYRRQDAVVGRQSYYSLYSAVNTLASHFTSYGPKFPFPNKRRPRFFELINTTEKYLEKANDFQAEPPTDVLLWEVRHFFAAVEIGRNKVASLPAGLLLLQQRWRLAAFVVALQRQMGQA